VRAARIHAYGGPEEIVIDDVPRPAVGPRDVLIEVHAAAVNPIDFKLRSGGQKAVVRWKLPHTLGMDASGVVVEAGDKVSRFEVGDAVFTSPTHAREGTYAEFVAVDEREVARKPSNVSHQEAAGIPLAGLTALQCVDAARVKSGDKVLVQAGAGGVGSIAIQICKHRGAEVATTCSSRNVELCTKLGADRVVDYTKERFDEVLNDYDVVLDMLGGDALRQGRTILKRGGYLVTVVSDIPTTVKRYGHYLGIIVAMGGLVAFKLGCMFRGLRFRYVLRKSDPKDLTKLSELIEAGAIEPLIDRVLPLEEAIDAHRHIESGRARGKIILSMKG
jgi:alcohol dehydrogenase